jgi:hypothetical protein
MQIQIKKEFLDRINYSEKDNFQIIEINNGPYKSVIRVLADSYFWTQIIYNERSEILVSEQYTAQDYYAISNSFEERFEYLNTEINNCIDDLLNCEFRYFEKNTMIGKDKIFQVFRNNKWLEYISNWNYRAFWKK